MSSVSTFAQIAIDQSSHYSNCSPEQALTYACEDLIDNELGSRNFSSSHLEDWMEHVCSREDLDMPQIIVRRSSPTVLASADIESHSICVRGKTTTAATVLHEIAHISVGVDSHGVLFRDELIRLARAHISIDYAALLHGVFSTAGLEMSSWAASASQR